MIAKITLENCIYISLGAPSLEDEEKEGSASFVSIYMFFVTLLSLEPQSLESHVKVGSM